MQESKFCLGNRLYLETNKQKSILQYHRHFPAVDMFLYHEKVIYKKLFSFHWPKVNRENERALRGTVQTDLEIRPLRGNSKKRVFTFVFPSVYIFRQGTLHCSGIIILSWGDRVSEW